MNKLLLPGIFAFLWSNLQSQIIPIGNGVYGQNANLTDTVGIKTNTGGKLNQFWDKAALNQNYVKESRVYFMRYGGIEVENSCLIDGLTSNPLSNLSKTIKDYVRKAIIMQKDSITPMLTLPLNLLHGLPNASASALKAGELVYNVNTNLVSQGYKPVLHWIYSNEPEQGGAQVAHNYDDTLAAQKIFTYIQAYYNAVYNGGSSSNWNNAWGTPVFIGPELYNFDNYNHGPGKVNRLVEQLTGHYTPYGNFDIRPYISVFSWHYYAFNTEADSTGGIPKPTRPNVVNLLALGAPKVGGGTSLPLDSDLVHIKTWLGPGKGIAITEANICHKNDVNPTDGYNVTDDGIQGNGANSFIGGQFWAELMSYGMANKMSFVNFWSGLEGCGTCTDSMYITNDGYLNSDPSKFGGLGGKKPSYHHFKMLSDNFHGNFYRGIYNHSGATPPPTFSNGNGVKAFASVEGAGIKIMVMNQNDNPYDFRINFNSSTTTNPNAIRISFPNMSNDPYIATTIDSLHYPTTADTGYHQLPARGTILLTFDCNGLFVSRQDYTEADAIAGSGPHYTRIGNIAVDPSYLAANVINCGHSGIGGNITSTTTYTNDTVYVTSNLQVNNGELTFDNCLVVVNPGVTIKTNPHGALHLKKTVIVGCGGQNWGGINMNGNHNNGERLKIENSAIFNAVTPVTTDKIPDLTITQSIFANGQTAFDLSRGKTFSITENLIAGFKTAIATSKTNPNYTSEIRDNKIVDVETAMRFIDDGHNQLDILCNQMLYRQKGIYTTNTDLKVQGTATMGAENTLKSHFLCGHKKLHVQI